MLKKILIAFLVTVVVGAVGVSAYNVVVDPASAAEPEIVSVAPEVETESEIVAAMPASDKILESEIPASEESSAYAVFEEVKVEEQSFSAQPEVSTEDSYKGSNGNGKGGGGNGHQNGGGNGKGNGGSGNGNRGEYVAPNP